MSDQHTCFNCGHPIHDGQQETPITQSKQIQHVHLDYRGCQESSRRTPVWWSHYRDSSRPPYFRQVGR